MSPPVAPPASVVAGLRVGVATVFLRGNPTRTCASPTSAAEGAGARRGGLNGDAATLQRWAPGSGVQKPVGPPAGALPYGCRAGWIECSGCHPRIRLGDRPS